jgi:uncharacterized membrane protein YdjX (TVP38/TMEM64 family)
MTDNQADTDKANLKHLMIGGAVLLVLILAFILSPFATDEIITWGTELSRHPLAAALIVLLMALLMSFGLPGSMCFWLIAPFHPPLAATALLVTGSCAGAIGAYHVGARLSAATPATRIGRQVNALLARRSDLLTQIALRMLPGFPHVLVNFTCGILKLPLPTFISAAVIGLTIKWAVYSSAVYGATSALQAEKSLSLSTLMPLAILGIMVLISGQVRRSAERKRKS